MSQPISMPWSAPSFPRPPHSFEGVRTAVFLFEPEPANFEEILPPGIEAAEGPGAVIFLKYPPNDIMHAFNECTVAVPVRVGDVLGNYIPYIYVTTDEALIPGRELAGFPKKIADIVWEREGENFRASLTRFGERILSLEGTITSPEPMAVESQAEMAQRPMINYKLIPGPAGEIEIEEITSTPSGLLSREMEVGTAKLTSDFAAADPVARLVPDSEGLLVLTLGDNTLPAGEVLVRIDRNVRA